MNYPNSLKQNQQNENSDLTSDNNNGEKHPKYSNIELSAYACVILGLIFYIVLLQEDIIAILFGVLLVIIGFILGFIALSRNLKRKEYKSIKRIAIVEIIIGCIMLTLIYITWNGLIHLCISDEIACTKSEQNSIANALNAYYTDNHSYPLPDYDERGKAIVPHILTTPIIYLEYKGASLPHDLPHDRFADNYQGFYGYGCDTVKGYIITSYGPDKVNGNSKAIGGSTLDNSIAWSDEKLGMPLSTSGFTYDPTNGIKSTGDIWRRGP